MLLQTNIENAPILSNVGQIGEFKIKSNSKAFQILSSGLYSNKIRAIIRELSCNAVDSHVAAGDPGLPISIHLPNSFEPYFSVRDFGIGLNHDQVTNIYTTYFESTKTDSNDYIGALGLGSKSPFSYTDNFTVTAIKDGFQRIYSAFINASGSPSIALMTESKTDEHNGVEVKLAVNNMHDFSKFTQEASHVFTYFKVKPNVIGTYTDVKIEYDTIDLVPGVNIRKVVGSSYNECNSIAIMGNIAYPIQIPNIKQVLGENAKYLKEPLDLYFNIGELDIQASREGLSYIPETIEAINKKLFGISDVLEARLAEQVESIPNFYEQCRFLVKKSAINMWDNAVQSYVKTSKNPLIKPLGTIAHYSSRAFNSPKFTNEELKNKYGIILRQYESNYDGGYRQTDKTQTLPTNERAISVPDLGLIIINDLTRGLLTRLKHNFHSIKSSTNAQIIYVLSPADKDIGMSEELFIKDIYNYPNVILASSLEEAPKKSRVNNTQIKFLKLKEKYSYKSSGRQQWIDAGTISQLDANQKYYYVELKGFILQTKLAFKSFKDYYNFFTNGRFGLMPAVNDIIAVRGKNAVDSLKILPNVINLEDHITALYNSKRKEIMQCIVLQSLNSEFFCSDRDRTTTLMDKVITDINSNSPFATFWNENKLVFEGTLFKQTNSSTLLQLIKVFEAEYDPAHYRTTNDKIVAIDTELKTQLEETRKQINMYEMLNVIDIRSYSAYSSNTSSVLPKVISNYINLIDSQKA